MTRKVQRWHEEQIVVNQGRLGNFLFIWQIFAGQVVVQGVIIETSKLMKCASKQQVCFHFNCSVLYIVPPFSTTELLTCCKGNMSAFRDWEVHEYIGYFTYPLST